MICLFLIVVPSLILTASVWLINRLQRQELKKQYQLTENVDPYSFNAAQRFDAMMHMMVNNAEKARAEDETCVLKESYLTELNGRMQSVGGYILGWQESGYYYVGASGSEGVQQYLAADPPADDRQSVYYTENERQYLIGNYSFTNSDGTNGILYLVTNVTNFLPALTRMIGSFLVVVAFVLLFSVLITGSWLRSTLVKPIGNLQEATKAIKDGNLEVPLEISGDDEVAELRGSLDAVWPLLRWQSSAATSRRCAAI